MNSFTIVGKTLMIFGAVLLVIGALMVFADKVPWLGKLPGDILVKRENFTFYFPLTTSIIISIVLSVFFWFWSQR